MAKVVEMSAGAEAPGAQKGGILVSEKQSDSDLAEGPESKSPVLFVPK
jgi:hypothetical protein